jgi:hypothetical protein
MELVCTMLEPNVSDELNVLPLQQKTAHRAVFCCHKEGSATYGDSLLARVGLHS